MTKWSVSIQHVIESCLHSSALQITPSANDSEYSKVHIPLALMKYRDFLEAQQVWWCFWISPWHFLFYEGESCGSLYWVKTCKYLSSGIWWRDAGEALRPAVLKGWPKHRCYAPDFRRHHCFGWFLEWSVWEVSYYCCAHRDLSVSVFHSFSFVCLVAGSDWTVALMKEEVMKTKQTVESFSCILLSKWFSLWPWCVWCWSLCISFTASSVSGAKTNSCHFQRRDTTIYFLT